MLTNEFEIDLTGVESQKFDLLPDGFYNVCCMKVEVSDTKDMSGKYLKCEFAVTDEGQFHSRRIFTNFNLVNKNSQAETIGRQQLKGFLEAAKHPNPDRPQLQTLVGLEAKAKVGVQKGKDGYEDSNIIKGFKETDKIEVLSKNSEIPF